MIPTCKARLAGVAALLVLVSGVELFAQDDGEPVIEPLSVNPGRVELTGGRRCRNQYWQQGDYCPPACPPATDGSTAAPQTPPTQPMTPESALQNPEQGFDTGAGSNFDLPSQGFVGGGGSVSAPGGYLDPAVVTNMTRFRFDAAYGNQYADRAEYFYAKCGCFRNPNLPASLYDPEAKGPDMPESSVDYQDYRLYNEILLGSRFSIFGESAIRSINPKINDNTTGLSDLQVGLKYAFIANPDQYLTFQFRSYVPTGAAEKGLGTGHVSLEPGLLYMRRWGAWTLQGEFKDWIPIDGSDFAGNVINYGTGLGYTVIDNESWSLTPVTELVSWQFLNGQKSRSTDAEPAGPNFSGTTDAGGDRVVNLKIGARLGLGMLNDRLGRASSLYMGYGHALTRDRLYRDMLRLEYRIGF